MGGYLDEDCSKRNIEVEVAKRYGGTHTRIQSIFYFMNVHSKVIFDTTPPPPHPTPPPKEEEKIIY